MKIVYSWGKICLLRLVYSFHCLIDQLFQPLQPKFVSVSHLVKMVDQQIQPALTLVDLVETKSTNSTGCFMHQPTSFVYSVFIHIFCNLAEPICKDF